MTSGGEEDLTCEEVITLLHELHRGGGSRPRRPRLRRHLAICPSCAAYLESYECAVTLAREALREETECRVRRAARPPSSRGRFSGTVPRRRVADDVRRRRDSRCRPRSCAGRSPQVPGARGRSAGDVVETPGRTRAGIWRSRRRSRSDSQRSVPGRRRRRRRPPRCRPALRTFATLRAGERRRGFVRVAPVQVSRRFSSRRLVPARRPATRSASWRGLSMSAA